MRILSLYIPLMLAAVTIAGCNSSATTPIPDEVARPVKTITVAQTSPSTTRSFPGVVEAAVQTSMAFRVGGPVTSFKVVIGERVAKGQELARIDSRDYEVRVTALQARLAEAQATLRAMRQGARAEDVATLKAERSAAASRLDEAEKNLQRYARLLAEGAIAKATVDSARTGLEAAKATLEGVDKNIEKATSGARVEDIEAMEARIKSITAELAGAKNSLVDTRLLAPFAGVVHEKLAEEHETVAPGQPVVKIFDSSHTEVTVRVPEYIVTNPAMISSVTCTIDTLPGKSFPASVKEIGQGSKAANQSYPLTAGIDLPADLSLYPGMAATLHITMNDGNTGAMPLVPLSALASDPEENSRVFLFDAGTSSVVPVAVSTGKVVGDKVEIREGISAGDRVVTAGARFLRPGQSVKLITPQND